MVYRRNPQYKKHKTWDGDAVLVVNGNSCTLYDTDGRQYVIFAHMTHEKCTNALPDSRLVNRME